MIKIITGDCRDELKLLPDRSVHTVVTSPPYFGLRDYGVDGQIGLEPTPAEFVAELVAVFREVRRVLRDDGTLWLNLGDSYANDGKWGGATGGKHASALHDSPIGRGKRTTGLKQKDLIGIPWRVAFALQDDGWYLRQDIIWAKPNPMPESVIDRCTKAHEYIFLLSKSPRYYFDAEAIAEPLCKGDAGSSFHTGKTADHQLGRASTKPRGKGNRKTFRGGGVYTQGRSFDNSADPCSDSVGNEPNEKGTRNKRSVWTVATQGYSEAHFATFPPDLIEPCILAGSPIGGTVLDPFGGAGTTALVSDRLGRDAISIELNPEYVEMQRKRISSDAGMFARFEQEPLPAAAE